jgi:hypothetical protein
VAAPVQRLLRRARAGQPLAPTRPGRELGDLHPQIWPLTACALAGGEISVGGVSLAEIAACYGTPAYVLDEADVRQRCQAYRQAFGDAEVRVRPGPVRVI